MPRVGGLVSAEHLPRGRRNRGFCVFRPYSTAEDENIPIYMGEIFKSLDLEHFQ